jgi:hypothetical protein
MGVMGGIGGKGGIKPFFLSLDGSVSAGVPPCPAQRG